MSTTTDAANPPQRLLVLDDQRDVGFTICAMARTLGFEARAETDADRFMAALHEWRPDCVILDLIMPGKDGVEVILGLAEQGCDASIVILSGAGARVLGAARRAAAEHGLNVSSVVEKPLSMAKLRLALGNTAASPPRSQRPARAPEWEPAVADLEQGLVRGELVPWFQPKVHCRSRRLEGFEALVRWHHPEHGLIMPNRFIGLAEESGLIDPLTEAVIGSAMSWLAGSTLGRNLRMAVNLSARSLGDLTLADRLSDACAGAGVLPDRLTLEVTETSAMTDPLVSLDVLTRLRLKGFELSIDDFGVGHSSLVQLARLPFSEMKIDMVFVREAATSAEARKIIRAIIGLGHSLGLKLTGEGVEDAAAFEYLRTAGCDYAQGYMIARPMPGDAVEEWWRTSELVA